MRPGLRKLPVWPTSFPNRSYGADKAEVLVVGWVVLWPSLQCSTTDEVRGKSVALAHFDYINPLPKNTAQVFARYKKIIVCELNSGQFVDYLRAKLPDFKYLQYNKSRDSPLL